MKLGEEVKSRHEDEPWWCTVHDGNLNGSLSGNPVKQSKNFPPIYSTYLFSLCYKTSSVTKASLIKLRLLAKWTRSFKEWVNVWQVVNVRNENVEKRKQQQQNEDDLWRNCITIIKLWPLVENYLNTCLTITLGNRRTVYGHLRNRLFKGLLSRQIYFQNFTAQKLRPSATTLHWGHKNKTATLV